MSHSYAKAVEGSLIFAVAAINRTSISIDSVAWSLGVRRVGEAAPIAPGSSSYGSAIVIGELPDPTSFDVAPASISSVVVSGFAWAVSSGRHDTPVYANLTVSCEWGGATRTGAAKAISPMQTAVDEVERILRIDGFVPSTEAQTVRCTATLYYGAAGQLQAVATNSTASMRGAHVHQTS
eukprot:tig00020824_g14280.t1